MRKLAAAGVITLLALSTSSCGLTGSGAGQESSAPPPATPPASAPASVPATSPATTTAATPSSAPSDTSATTQPTPADPDQPTGGDQLGQVVVTRNSATDETKIQLKLYPLQRDGRLSHLNFTLSSPATGTEAGISTLLSDGNTTVGDGGFYTVDGIQVVDAKNAKVYLVASDGNHRCLCSRNLGSVYLKDNVPTLFSASFAAPPADVTSVEVIIPAFGTVKNVPVQ